MLTDILRRISGWRRRAAAVEELRRFDRQQLRDLGIERAEIEAYVDGRLTR